MTPLVSIIMNCFNGEKYILQSIESVLSQNYTNWELIFWDNQSNDGTSKKVKLFSDKRIRYFYSDKHTPLYEARNRALLVSKGDLISFLDVDDTWEPTKISTQVDYFVKHPNAELIFTNYTIHNTNNNTRILAFSKNILNKINANDLIKNYRIGILTVMMRKSTFIKQDIKFNPAYHIIGDFDLFIRLSLRIKINLINLNLATYKVHGENEGIKNKNKYFDEINDWCIQIRQSHPILNVQPILNKAIYGRCCTLLDNDCYLESIKLSRKLTFGILKIKLIIKILLKFFSTLKR